MNQSTAIVIKPTTAHLEHDKDLLGKMDPYVIFKINGAKQRSKVHRSGGKRPVWKESFLFEVLPGQSDVRITVKDKDRFKWDDHIGSCNVDLLEATKLGKSDLWYELFRKGKKTGSIHLIIATKEYMDNNPCELNPKSASGNTHINTYGVPQGAMEQAFGNGSYKVHQSSLQSSAVYEDAPISETSSSNYNSTNNSRLSLMGSTLSNPISRQSSQNPLPPNFTQSATKTPSLFSSQLPPNFLESQITHNQHKISQFQQSDHQFNKKLLHAYSTPADYCFTTRF